MATVAESLFGVTPESLQRQRQQQLRQEAMDFATITDPFQRANYSIYQGVGDLTRGIGGLLGAEDPELMRVRQRQQLLQGVDISDPLALRDAASRLLQRGDSFAASQLSQRAQDIEVKKAQILKDTAEASSKLSEKMTDPMKNAQAKADMSGAPRGSAEWNKVYNSTFDSLIAKTPSIDNVGVAVGTQQPVYFDKNTNQQFVIVDGQRRSYSGGVDRTTSKVSATSISKGQDAYSTEFGQGLAKQDLSLKESAEAAPEALRSVELTRGLLDSGKVFTGTGANVKLNVLALGQSLGVTGATADEIVANTQQLQQQRSKAVLNQIKQSGLGTGQGFTDKDLAFLQDAAAGRITLSPETLRRQLNLEERVFKATANKWNERITKLPPQFVNTMGLSPVQLPTKEKPAEGGGVAPRTPTKRYNPATGQLEQL